MFQDLVLPEKLIQNFHSYISLCDQDFCVIKISGEFDRG